MNAFEQPKTTAQQISDGMTALVLMWQHAALNAADIAHARRVLFDAYIAEGFTEAQAIELVKQP